MRTDHPACWVPARPYPFMLDRRNSAVLVVDMQQGFAGLGGWWDVAGVDVSGVRATLPRIARVLDACRQVAIPVIYLAMDLEGAQDVSDPRLDHYFASVRPPFATPKNRRATLPPGVRQSDILPELKPQAAETIIIKPHLSGFYETDLDVTLRDLGVTSLIFTGCTTSICVESTLRDASFRDYRCLALSDCMDEPIGSGYQRTNHEATLLQVELTFGWVADSAAFISALDDRPAVGATAGTPTSNGGQD